jgi:DNA replication and repair protein RecF
VHGTGPVYIERLQLQDFRNFSLVELAPAQEGVTLVVGPNGSGKTNLLESVSYLATLKSFRGAQVAAMVRAGRDRAFVAAKAQLGQRSVDLAAEITASRAGVLRVNNQTMRRSSDFVGLLQVSIFSPDDMAIVKTGPSARRDFLDQLLVAMSPKLAGVLASFERSLRQRNAILRSGGGVLSTSARRVLASWDVQVAEAGEALAAAREGLVEALRPRLQVAYGLLGGTEGVDIAYERSWEGPLLRCLDCSVQEDLRQGATTVGPQRDDLYLLLGDMSARAQASQGQQRSLALAMKLAAHELLGVHYGSTPVLLLDDVFSELDRQRAAALASCLRDGQVLVATAGEVPKDLNVAEVVQVSAGSLSRGSVAGSGGGI